MNFYFTNLLLQIALAFFLNILNKSAPMSAPYKVLLTGLEVIIQVPDEQPICCQYK